MPKANEGSARSPIDDFLMVYDRALRGRPKRARIVAEARSHLLDSAERLVDSGHDRLTAERTALERFGDEATLLAAWRRETPPLALGSWLISTSLSPALGLALVFLGGRHLSVTHHAIIPVAGLVIGCALAIAQAQFHRSRWSIAATSIAISLGITISTYAITALDFVKRNPAHDLASLALLGLVTGALHGALQRNADLCARSAIALAIGCAAGGAIAAALFGDMRSVPGLLLLATIAGGSLAASTAPVIQRSTAPA